MLSLNIGNYIVISFLFYFISFDGPFSTSQIANMDEVPLVFDMTPNHTLEQRGASEVGIRVSTKYKVQS